MKKYFMFLLIPIFFWGCEKDYENVVENQISYQVESVSSVDKFVYSVDDSLIIVSIKVNSSSYIKNIFFDIYSSDDTQLNNSPVELYDNGFTGNGDTTAGDNRYSTRYPLSRIYPFGIYTIKYFITDINDITKQVAVKTFEYDNGQENAAPFISNLVMPDSIKKEKQFIFTVTASDSNGLSDIKNVFYKTYRPDGTLVVNSEGISQFPLFDDGKTSDNGDKAAGDGIFSVALTFPSNQPSGIWRFDFQATDRRGKASNIISHNIVVQ